MIQIATATISLLTTLVLGTLAPSSVFAHGEEDHEKKAGTVKKEQKDWGIAGDANKVKRTIEIGMMDAMKFSPDKISVKQGETIRFIVKNTSPALLHEFVIGTKKENDAHAALMVKFPTMEHSEPYMAHVAPKKTGEIIWAFNRPGDFEFACLIAGHYQAGMVGKIKVATAK